MIKAYEFSDNRLKPLENFEASVAGQPWPVWIDVISPTPEEDRSVETLLSISLPTREEMTQIEVSERLYQDDGAEFMTLTAIASIETEDPETGRQIVRMDVIMDFFGETLSGSNVAGRTRFTLDFCYDCGGCSPKQ